ncbi:GAF and ANTAR domain-containing protein [Modestobacter altitudinis]|uniref:GAF and ANTAR domain-containing protein n=1 Tax=Modestobacter altitudinis TaxID=2213158 RepID=UPI00110CF2F2|nr:GAF and ANTAR domain-containing protein [Modestobacter altitudinis]
MADLTALHEALSRVVLVDRDLGDALCEITEIGRRAIPGSESASVTLIGGGKPRTAAFQGQLAVDAEELQYGLGHGPCLDAGRAGLVFLVSDMGTEQRWPDYAAPVVECGVRSSLTVPLPFLGATIGALNHYATRPAAFDEDDVARGEEMAGFIAVAVANAQHSAQSAEEAENMRRAMVSRAMIEQAKGILMERHKMTADAAFTVLSHASQNNNLKLREVADHLVTTGEVLGPVQGGA